MLGKCHAAKKTLLRTSKTIQDVAESCQVYSSDTGQTPLRRTPLQFEVSKCHRCGLLDGPNKTPVNSTQDLLTVSEVGRSLGYLVHVKSAVDAVVEGTRLIAVSRLSLHFERAVARYFGKSWNTLFEELLMCHDRSNDPIIPTDSSASAFLCDRLASRFVPSQEINGILFDLLIEISAARHTISKVALSRTAYLATPSPNVFRSTTGKSIKLTLHDAEVEINEQQYEKLRWLYESDIQATQFGGTCAKPSLANTFCESGITFHSAVFAMLCLYASAHGGMHCMAGGHHNALHGDVFDALNIGLGVHAECCASPLNCHWRLYCSGHPDTDLTFGSLGSVFSFDPVDGYFECNPPFEESVLLDCIKHIDSLLDVAEVAGKSLSCVFIVPHWPGRRAWETLFRSVHKSHTEVIPLREHGFLEVLTGPFSATFSYNFHSCFLSKLKTFVSHLIETHLTKFLCRGHRKKIKPYTECHRATPLCFFCRQQQASAHIE